MVAIRSASPDDAPAIARVYVETWRTAYRGIVPASYLAGMSEAAWEGHWRRVLDDPEGREILRCVLVAETEVGVVGFATGCREWSGDGAYEGELDDVYVLQAHQRHGLGRLLVGGVAGRLGHDGLRSLLVWVADRSPACAFYTALGGTRLDRGWRRCIGGATVDVVAYGWRSLSGLRSRETPSFRPHVRPDAAVPLRMEPVRDL